MHRTKDIPFVPNRLKNRDIQRFRLDSLVRISELPLTSINMEDLYTRAIRILAFATHSDIAVLYILSSSKEEYIVHALSNIDPLLDTRPLPCNIGRLGILTEMRRIIVFGSTVTDPRDIDLSDYGAERYHTGVCVPITIAGETAGFFTLLFKDIYGFCSEDKYYLLSLGEILSVAIQCRQALQQLADQVTETNINSLAEIRRDMDRLLGLLTFQHVQSLPESTLVKPLAGFRKNADSFRIVEALTSREVEVLRLLAEGYSNTEIGKILFISEGTVKKRVGCILRKLGFTNRVQAAAYAFRQGYMQ